MTATTWRFKQDLASPECPECHRPTLILEECVADRRDCALGLDNPENRVYRVYCTECGISGGVGATQEAAEVEFWMEHDFE